jgi:hypothetical protein
MRIKGTLHMFVLFTEDDGFIFHSSLKDAAKDVARLQQAGANGIIDIEEVDLITNTFEFTEDNENG